MTSPARPPSEWIVVSDLDGCLLDSKTYSYDAARPALQELRRLGTPLVLCSGKTRAEMQALADELGLQHPFIVENGGAIVFPDPFDGPVAGAQPVEGARILRLGAPRAVLVVALRDIASEAGVKLRGFTDLRPEDIQELTGLSLPAATLALQREHDEPFLVEDESTLPMLARAAARRGLQLSHGGRFHHLMGGSDKGLAVRTLLAAYHRGGHQPLSAGLGDAETDLTLLKAVDRPIVVPRPDGRIESALSSALPSAERAPLPGPPGWNAAVLTLLAGQGLPRVGDAPTDAGA